MFAVALVLVVVVSTSVLLYQYWSGSLLVDDGSAGDAAPSAPESLPATSRFIDHAA